jgi:hypothetical protein
MYQRQAEVNEFVLGMCDDCSLEELAVDSSLYHDDLRT